MRTKRNGNSSATRKTKKAKYKSKLEERVAEQLERARVKYEYESDGCKIHYKIPSSNHIYLNDFKITTKTGKTIYIEAKGIWDYADRYKHYLIRKQHEEKDVRFVFQRAGNKIRRGSGTSYADICNGKGRGIFKGVKWLYGDGGKVPKEWFNE